MDVAGGTTALDDAERTILDLEQQHWRYAGSKEVAIRERLGVSPTRYAMRLNRLLDDERALAYAPVMVNRLRRERDRRRVSRRLAPAVQG